MARLAPGERDKVRVRLLETAAQHFARHGYERAIVDTISRDAGYAKGTIYNYFESKADLFGAVIEEGARRAAELYEAAPGGSSTREHLLALARADLSLLREEEAFIQVIVREALSFRSGTYALIISHLAPFLAKVIEILDAGVRAGEVRDDTPTPQMATMFTGLLSFAYVQHWGSGGVWPPLDDIPELCVTSFLDGAGRGPR